jgi:hypothetical protein
MPLRIGFAAAQVMSQLKDAKGRLAAVQGRLADLQAGYEGAVAKKVRRARAGARAGQHLPPKTTRRLLIAVVGGVC